MDPSASDLPDGAWEWLTAHAPAPPQRCVALAGGAGRRRYWRVHLPGARTSLLMWALSEDPAILPPGLQATSSGIPFLEVASFLEAQGVPVPHIFAWDVLRRFVLLEDLGSTHVLDLSGEERLAAHREAIDLLARVHAITPPASLESAPLPFKRQFDREWLAFEARLFVELPFRPATRQRVEAALSELCERIALLPRVVCLRDYQSQNLLVDPQGRLRVIDFQDALMAAAALDLASLLWDSYLRIPATQRQELLERYSAVAPRPVAADELALLAVHRKCKDLSRYLRVLERGGPELYRTAKQNALEAIRTSLAELPPDLSGVAEPIDSALRELAQ